MDIGLHHLAQRGVDQPVPGQRQFACKCSADDLHAEVALAAAGTGMTGMLVAVVGHLAGQRAVPVVAAKNLETFQKIAGRTPPDAEAVVRVNAGLMRASRALVPADYTHGDRFLHPHALPVPAWPTLQAIRDLAATEAESDAERFARVDALRASNRIAHALRDAQAALDGALAALE